MKMRQLFFPILICSVVCASEVPNGDFEKSADGRVAAWTAPGMGAWRAHEGLGGGGALMLTGGKDQRWESAPTEFASGARYAFVFSAKGPASGSLTAGPNSANFDLPAPGAEWRAYTNVFRAQTPEGKTYKGRFHLGEWKMGGRVLFDDAKLVPVVARWKQLPGGIELGGGESVEGNTYSFGSQFGGPGRNDARVLVGNRCGFNTCRWTFGGKSEVVYRHALAGRKLLSASLTATCGYYAHGSVVVEVSKDGTAWKPLFTIASSSSPRAEVPGDLFPTDAVWVRFRGLDDSDLQIYDYAFDAKFDGAPMTAFGTTDYVEEGTGRTVASIKASVYYDEGYGARVPGGTDKVALWTASSGWKIPRTRSVPTATAPGVEIRTAANEAEAVQLVVCPAAACRDVRVTAGDLKDAQGRVLAASAIDVLRVGYVRIEKPTDGVGCRALWPDPLPPQTGAFAVPANENQPFWVRVKPPKGTPAGVYRGTLKVVCADLAPMEVPFSVEVFGFDLPDRMTVETAFGCDFNQACRYQKAKTPEDRRTVCDAYLRALADHHLSPYNPTPCASWKVTWKGLKENPLTATPVFDWTEWDRAAEKAFNEYHFTGMRFAVEGLGGGDWEHRVEPVYKGFKGGTPEYEALMSKYLGGIEAHLREKGWLDKMYVYWYDEPETRDYPFVMNGFNTLKKYAPGLRRMLTEEPCADLLGGPNTWCPLTPNLRSSGEPAARKLGDVFWWYVCCGPKAPYVTEFTDHPGSEMRLWLWQTWGEDVQGVLIWTTTWWTSSSAYPEKCQNPYEDAMSWMTAIKFKPGTKVGWGNGDGRFLYPPLAAADGTQAETVLDPPVASFRIELLRDGIEDYEYFAMLKRLLKARTDLSAADRAKYEALLRVPKTVYSSMTEFTIDPAPMETHRLALARAIEALVK